MKRLVKIGDKMIYVTGDKHRNFNEIKKFCKENNTTKDDVIIILGDVGINFYVGIKDWSVKHSLSKLPITLFCIHGNHEQRPFAIATYREVEKFGAKAYMEEEFDNIIFAKDGEIYNFAGLKCMAIGGAYSTDKYYRLTNNWKWFSNEQPNDRIKKYVEDQLESINWNIDLVFSHTCPFKYRPIERLSSIIDLDKMDTSTEEWLQKIEDRLKYKKWYCGHFHIEKSIDKIRFAYDDIIELNPLYLKDETIHRVMISDSRRRQKKFFELWEKEVAPYISKDKYEFFGGNDLLIKNFNEKDDEILNNFLTKYHNFFKYLKLKKKYVYKIFTRERDSFKACV